MNSSSDVALWSFHQTDNTGAFRLGHARQDALFNEVRKLAPSGRILEIGFGDGYLLSRLAEKYDAYGADISPDIVEQMKLRVPSAKFDLTTPDGKLPYADGFDLFVASEVLEHMDDAELRTAIGEIHRVLKPGGRALITVPARENLQENKCFCPNCGTSFHKWGHKQRWDRERLHLEFARFSIENIEERYFRTPGLNAFGRIEEAIRIAASKVRQMAGMTFSLCSGSEGPVRAGLFLSFADLAAEMTVGGTTRQRRLAAALPCRSDSGIG